jgi:hypothetical protein
MPALEDMLSYPVIHTTRSDGALLIAIRTPLGDVRLNRWGWILVVNGEEDSANQSDIDILTARTGHNYARLYKLDELKAYAEKWQCTDWEEGYQDAEVSSKSSVDGEAPKFSELIQEAVGEVKQQTQEQLNNLTQSTQKQLDALSQSISTLKTQVDEAVRERRRGKTAQELVDKNIQAAAAEVAKRTSEHTMAIISEQVELGAAYYQNVVVQSEQSFNLARWLTLVGAGIFVISMVMLLIPTARGNTVPVGITGTIASAIVEVIAGLSFLYNKASEQFARFHLFLDRTNRASIAHAMCNSIKDEAKRQELIVSIIQEIMKSSEELGK